MSHVMLDLETWGRPPDGVIISIGAVNFDISTGEGLTSKCSPHENVSEIIPAEFSMVVDAEDARRRGMTINGGTVYWWFRQDPAAINAWLKADCYSLESVVRQFDGWYRQHKPKVIWGNSPSFDCDILGTAFKLCGYEVPWSHREERCVRTYVHAARMAGYPKQTRAELEEAQERGTAHNAVDDCLHQIRYVSEIFHFLNKNVPENEVEDLTHKVEHLLQVLRDKGPRDQGNFPAFEDSYTFPDGDTWKIPT